RGVCWFSWDIQIESVEKLKHFENVNWVFPGHGHRGQVEDKPFSEVIDEAVTWMRSVR
ncbi:MAG: MBL fold metallo-hydrolase, partial [Nitrospinae bacterium]|nr:MBL fold metallo-hydrolase [Nitrospinota bacterium]